MTQIIDGKTLARTLEADVAREVAALDSMGAAPLLASVQVGPSPAVELYIRHQARAAERTGIAFRRIEFAADISERQLQREVERLSQSSEITGVMLQTPLPPHISVRAVRRALDPWKDVEGVHPANLGWLLSDRPGLVPCTAAAALECILSTGVELRGKEAVVVGHSETVGKPIALLLMERLATVTVCHHGTADLLQHVRRAEVLVVAVGRAGLVKCADLRAGAIVIDVGINEIECAGRRKLVGDVEADQAHEAAWITPVPGGVGPVTVALLMRNTLRAAARQIQTG
ncbi:MAG: bifunctional 5,10-methylenetetrahydrofolate dehydrogenase/5,10-methenyltetrahydrofolate cyclohydrolase [Planctomycetes bacterium]|nr:bifunctional 5,10-methylenetetrahydrofolate dehydrogenase/5,10-methenyltetrahydrofolate cyclohydrolase [Planctomycetota bacterium]